MPFGVSVFYRLDQLGSCKLSLSADRLIPKTTANKFVSGLKSEGNEAHKHILVQFLCKPKCFQCCVFGYRLNSERNRG